MHRKKENEKERKKERKIERKKERKIDRGSFLKVFDICSDYYYYQGKGVGPKMRDCRIKTLFSKGTLMEGRKKGGAVDKQIHQLHSHLFTQTIDRTSPL